MRVVRGIYGALLILAIGASSEALAACCSAPVHVYVPPPRVVVVPHTTYVHPVTPQVHSHTTIHTQSNPSSASTPPTVHGTRTHRVEQPIVVSSTQATSVTRCKRDHTGDGCKKKDEEPTTWATVRHWLQLDKH